MSIKGEIKKAAEVAKLYEECRCHEKKPAKKKEKVYEGQLWEECERCGNEPIYSSLNFLCEDCG